MKNLFQTNKSSANFLIENQIPQVSKLVFTIKPLFSRARYIDLDSFRQQIEESKAGLHHRPYTLNKKNTAFYRSIFLGFALFFFLLAMTVLALPSALGCGFFFSSCSFLKSILVTFCITFFLISLTIALRLKAEKEAVIYYVRKTKAHVAAIYARKKVRIGIKNLFSLIGPNRLKLIALNQLYHEINDKINDKKDETLHLLHQIATAETFNELEKEDLLNQALEEFNEKLQFLTQDFRHTIPKGS